MTSNSSAPQPHEQLTRFGPGFWRSGCTATHAEVDLFWFDDTLTGVRSVIHYHIAIPRAAVFPLVRRPFERRLRLSVSNSFSSNSTSNSSSNSTLRRRAGRRAGDVARGAVPTAARAARPAASARAHLRGRGAALRETRPLARLRCSAVRTFLTLLYSTLLAAHVKLLVFVLVLVQRGLRGDLRRAAGARAVRLAPRERHARRRAAAQPARAALRVRAAEASVALTPTLTAHSLPFSCSRPRPRLLFSALARSLLFLLRVTHVTHIVTRHTVSHCILNTQSTETLHTFTDSSHSNGALSKILYIY